MASSSLSSEKYKITIKKQKLIDEYVLTNKHIICKFKYLVTCLCQNEYDNNIKLVYIPTDKFQELLEIQEIKINETDYEQIVDRLRQWHPNISKIQIEFQRLYELQHLQDYSTTVPQLVKYLAYIAKENKNQLGPSIMADQLINQPFQVINVSVFFQLTHKINNIADYRVNFKYLHQLLTQELLNWNLREKLYLDEISLEQIGCVAPYIYLIPLYRV